MSRNTMYALVALMLVVLVGLGGGYWVLKKYRAKQNKEYRYEARLALTTEGADSNALKEKLLSDEVVEKVANKLNLISKWEMKSVSEVKMRLMQKFSVKVTGKDVIMSYQDKDQDLAKVILETIVMVSMGKHEAP